jgi:glycosyltransferase involved in cell wall biosynthesis
VELVEAMTEIVAALRVKNEGRWIREALEAIRWTDGIYLMDDHSDDDTREIAASCGAIVMESPFDTFDEARDKEWLIGQVAQNHPIGTWVLLQDGDEVLEDGGEQGIRAAVSKTGGARAFSLRIKFLWDSRNQYRVDGVYGGFNRPSLFMLLGNYSFRRSGVNGNLHPSCVPAANRPGYKRLQVALLHLGYIYKEDRIRKWKFYNSMDPKNIDEGYDPKHPERGSYPHVVQGDIPEVPATAILRHSGPLELRPL